MNTASPGKRRLRKAVGVTAVVALSFVAVAYYHWLRTHLTVTSTPAGAQVRLDGELLGRTPLSGVALSPGLHLVEVVHSHYRVHQQQVSVTQGEHRKLHIDLEPGRGKVLVHSNPRGAWVEVDGERQPGTAPMLLDLASGPRELALGMDERRAVSEQIVVMADQTLELRLDLNIDPHGSLWVEPQPADARITLLNGERNYEPGVRLPIGEYPVRISRTGYLSREVRLEVRYGDNRHAITLERAYAPLTVTTAPAGGRVRVRFREALDGRLAWRAYRPEMRLPVGEVEVRASAMGRRSAYRRLDLPPQGASLHLPLATMNVTVGERFRDGLEGLGEGPEMVVVPPGRFVMGRDDGPPSEAPARTVELTEPFAVSITEITVGDYRRFRRDTGRSWNPQLVETPDEWPVSYVDFADAAACANWLSARTGHRYRLLSEAEWEYMARAGAGTDYFFGDETAELCRYANVADQSMRRRFAGYDTVPCDDGFVELAPAGSFPPNAFGIHDVHGNVAEWVLECGMPPYEGAPEDGSPIDEDVNCPTHGIRGGSWDDPASNLRAGKRNVARSASSSRGIRLLREL